MNSPSVSTPHSTFVTVVAWVFIVLAGIGTLISIAQNQMIHSFPTVEMQRSIERSPPDVPGYTMFMLQNMRVVYAVALVLYATTFVAAIALLRRRNWGRVLFIAMLALAIAWNLGGIYLQMAPPYPTPPGAPLELQEDSQAVASNRAMLEVLVIVMGLSFAGLFAYLIHRLVSPEVKQEFGVS